LVADGSSNGKKAFSSAAIETVRKTTQQILKQLLKSFDSLYFSSLFLPMLFPTPDVFG
jgi:hypothetical protein